MCLFFQFCYKKFKFCTDSRTPTFRSSGIMHGWKALHLRSQTTMLKFVRSYYLEFNIPKISARMKYMQDLTPSHMTTTTKIKKIDK